MRKVFGYLTIVNRNDRGVERAPPAFVAVIVTVYLPRLSSCVGLTRPA